MYDRFKELGIPVELTRDSDVTLTSDNRPKVALSKFGNDKDVIIISNHINAGGGEGAEVIYALRNSDTLAKTILDKLGQKGQLMRRYYQRRLPSDMSKDYYFMLRNTPNAETIIVEYGFIDTPKDAEKLKRNYKEYADAVIDAVLEYKNISTLNNDYYIVKKGDTLWSISKKYNINVEDIKNLNNLTSNSLTIGQKLILNKEIIPDEMDIVENNSETYVVVPGDTLYNIARKFNIDVNTLKDINNLSSNTLSIGQILLIDPNLYTPSETFDETDIYIVKAGDTLYKIANKYGITVNELKNLNNLTNNILSINQELKVPNSKYIVKKGDTLWSISKNNNISVNKLKELNNLTSNTLSIGQELIIR